MGREEGADDRGFAQFEQFLEEWSRRDFLRRMGASAAWLAFSAGAAELLAACGGGQNTTNNTAVNPVKGGKLIEGFNTDIATFNSLNSGDVYSSQMIVLTLDGLLSLDGTGNNVPMLAQSLPTVSSDGLTYTFKLRPNLKWTDGQPLTTDDVVFTYNLMFQPDTKDFVSRYRASLDGYLQSVTAVDQQTVVFKLSKVLANFLDSHCRYGILPKHVLGGVSPKALNTHAFFSGPSVSSGVFKFVKWDKGQQVVLARNDGYWNGASYLDQYIFKIVSDAVVLAQQLKTGEIDCGQPDASQFDNLKTATSLTTTSFTQAGFVYYQFNLGPGTAAQQLFGDKNVRKALQLGLDRTAMAQAAYFGQAVPADSVLWPSDWAYNAGVTPKYPFDKAKAEQLLDAAGWTKGSDGIRAKNGVKLSFELNTNAGNKVRENLIQIMQQQWHDIGVEAKPRPIAFTTLVTQIRSTHSFYVILIGIANTDTDPDQTTLFTTKGIGSGGLNGMQYSNPQVDDLMEKALQVTDHAKRKPYYTQIQNILADDIPAAILFYPKWLFGINKRVQGFNVATYNVWQARPWMNKVFVSDGK